ncbi:MAG: LysR family transcriptional regulator [Clostridia bacterium]|nr:LysR family transcriptional regulator [Clostridia bacterium]
MDLLQLKYFCDSAESQNFSQTARKYQVPPSGVSQSVKRLESELGVPLFDRKNNKVVLNRTGERFYAKVKQSLSLLDQAVCEVQDESLEGGESIRLLVYTNRQLVTRVIGAFKSQHPNVSFVIHHKPDDIKDTYDLVISDDLSFCKEYDPELFLSERIILALSREHRLVREKKISAEELAKEGFIFMDEGSSLCRRAADICEELCFEPHVVIRTDDPSLIRTYVSLGLGVAFVPEFSWKNSLDETVALRSLGDYRRDTYLFWKKNAYRTRTVLAFAEALRTQLAEEQRDKN